MSFIPFIVTDDPSQKNVSDKNFCNLRGFTFTKIIAESDLHKPSAEVTTSLYSVSSVGETLGLAILLENDEPVVDVQEYL
jgi:hypothetical protein